MEELPIQVTKQEGPNILENIVTIFFGLVLVGIVVWALDGYYNMKYEIRYNCMPRVSNIVTPK